MPPKSRTQKVRRKEKKNVAQGEAHIKSTFNNTIVTITDPTGAVISWASAGTVARTRCSTARARSLENMRLVCAEPGRTFSSRRDLALIAPERGSHALLVPFRVWHYLLTNQSFPSPYVSSHLDSG